MRVGLDILLVEDNDALAANVGEYLEARGHRLTYAHDGQAGLSAALDPAVDVAIIDIALPRLDGLELCRALRERAERHVPVLMLTARDTLDDKLAGFDSGADDYLTKPFALAELAARVEALSTRGRIGSDHRIFIGYLELDRRRRVAVRDGVELRLNPQIWTLLAALAEAYPAAVSRSELTRRLWGDDPPQSDALKSLVHLLRLSLDRPFGRPMLATVHGVGYRLVASG